MVAQAAGVSKATVSFALRQHPSIPNRTCERIARIAENLGYRPDPEISRLMAHVRRGDRRVVKASLGFINSFAMRQPWTKFIQVKRIVEGVSNAAELLGYSIDHQWIGDPEFSPRRIEQILISRGINGVLLLGTSEPIKTFPMDISRFSVATIGYSIGLQIHRACPNQYRDTLTAMRNIRRLGYQRPGIVLNRNTDRRVERLFLAAYLIAQYDLEPENKIPPLVADDLEPDDVVRWFEQYSPDVIIVQAPPVSDFRRWLEVAGHRVPEDVGVVSLDLSSQSGKVAGILQNHEAVGETATKLLIAQIQRSEQGLAEHPSTVLVNGSWVDGLTAPGPM